MAAFRALAVLSFALAGCASTSGQEWLSSPIDQRSESSELSASAVEPSANVDSRPRLNHSVTLGESYEAAPEPYAAAPGAPSVQVNVSTPVIINNMGGGYGYGYGYGYAPSGYGARGVGAGGSSRAAHGSAPTKVGGDFPAPPDYGPRALR